MKDQITFRFRSWALMPDTKTWSPWNHCSRKTMMDFLDALKRLDEYSTVRNSPTYNLDYAALIEVQVIVNDYDCWKWTPAGGWQRMPEDPRFADIPTGKGNRPPKKSRAQLEADRKAADAEIFGTADEITMDDIDDPLNPDR